MNSVFNSPVYPIPALFKHGKLSSKYIGKYVNYLANNGATTFCTTAGTSQFNHLINEEISELNFHIKRQLEKHQNIRNINVIYGLPNLDTDNVCKFINLYPNNLYSNNSVLNDSYVLALYPDRYYNDSAILKHFHTIADQSRYPVFIHGMKMRHGISGEYNYTPQLWINIFDHDNIVGMKEENLNLSESYNVLQELNWHRSDLEIIVAGGSQRRFNFLKSAGATNYLAGIGSFYPEIENKFWKLCTNNARFEKTQDFIRLYEGTLFRIFMKYGWHLCMREAIRQLVFPEESSINRQPFPECSESISREISAILKEVEIAFRAR